MNEQYYAILGLDKSISYSYTATANSDKCLSFN